MIRGLIGNSLKARWLVALLSSGLLVAGIQAAQNAPLDAFPEFSPPLVELQTEAPGLSSLDVEQLVTTPLENVLAGVPFVKTVRSKSVLGLSSVVLLFEPGTDLLVARQLTQERIARAAAALPATARTPVMLAPLSSTSRAMKIGLTSRTHSQVELTDLVRWTLRPRLLAIAGVANVATWGARDREYRIEVDFAQLQANGLTLDELTRTVRNATTPMAGGFLDGPTQRLPLTHTAIANDVESLARTPIATRNGAVLRIEDVATVRDTFAPPIGDAVVNDEAGLLLIVQKQPWGNTLEITRKVDEVLAAVKPALPGVDVDAHLFRPAAFVERSISNLEHALYLGCLLVVLVLWLFLWNWRTALISSLAIPLSLAAAMLALRGLGGTLNTMILAGLVIALGEVVDDAIIDVENIHRRLHSHPERSRFQIVLEASLEVRSAVVYATVIVVLVFLPVWFLGGVSGAFFRPLALAYGLCVGASLLVALIITPALSMILLKRDDHAKPSPVLVWLSAGYERLLPRLIDHPRLIIAGTAASLFIAISSAFFLETAFLPDFEENDFLMHWVAQPGTSLPALARTAQRVSRELRAIPGVTSFGSHLGRAEAGDEIVGPNFGELWIHVDESASHAEVSAKVEAVIEKYPGLRRDLETYLRERISEVITGTQGAIVVRLFGPDLDTLRSTAADFATALRSTTSIKSARVEQQVLVPELRATPKPEAAALGFLAGDVRNTLDVLLRGQRVGELIAGGRTIPVVISGPGGLREDLSALRRVEIDAIGGARARLEDVVALTIEPVPNLIAHESTSRRIDVSIEVNGDLDGAAHAVEAAIATHPWPEGHHAELLGEWKERGSATRQLALFSVLSLIAIIAVLFLDLGTIRRTVLVAVSLPFALVGGIAGAWLSGGVLSLGSIVGLVTVLGIAARNGILLVAHYRQLEEHEGMALDAQLIIKGSLERLGPILMTALATGLALVPLALGGHTAGHEIEHPLAVVVLGGLASSTALNLLVIPALYLRTRQSFSTTVA